MMPRYLIVLSCLLFFTATFSATEKQNQSTRHRLIILADMGNEPDEEQQMIHMLMYSNEFDLEGLIAVTGRWLGPHSEDPYHQVLHPELFHKLIDGYAKVLDNLKVHASGWYDPDYLHGIVVDGQKGYGTQDIGKGKSSPGSELIIESVTKNDDRPVWIVVNAGSNTLAQALCDYSRSHSKKDVEAFIRKIRVYENGAQDNAGAWICANFSEIHWLRSNTQTYCYGGPGWHDRTFIGPYTWQPYEFSEMGQNFWAIKHIKAEHGELGALYPLRQFGDGSLRYLEGGGTIPWMGLVNKGLYDINNQHWGGWGGRFSKEKMKNKWSGYKTVKADEEIVAPFYLYSEAEDYWVNPETGEASQSVHAPVWRWRRAMYNDFQCRMDWCVQSFADANHNPIAHVNGDDTDQIIFKKARPKQVLNFDASTSIDPDRDALTFDWWVYKEAGTYSGDLPVEYADSVNKVKARLIIPEDAKGSQIHLILEVKDQNPIVSLYDYRRIVITVLK